MSKADEVARGTLDSSHQLLVCLNNVKVPVITAWLLMLIETGSVSSADTRSSSQALTRIPAHLSSLSTPGSGLLHLDDSMAQINPKCCSLPTQPVEMTRSTEDSMTSIPPTLQNSDFGGNDLDDPIRIYGSDETL